MTKKKDKYQCRECTARFAQSAMGGCPGCGCTAIFRLDSADLGEDEKSKLGAQIRLAICIGLWVILIGGLFQKLVLS